MEKSQLLANHKCLNFFHMAWLRFCYIANTYLCHVSLQNLYTSSVVELAKTTENWRKLNIFIRPYSTFTFQPTYIMHCLSNTKKITFIPLLGVSYKSEIVLVGRDVHTCGVYPRKCVTLRP